MNDDRCLPEFHLKQPEFTHSAYWPFTKHHKRIQKCRETGNLKYLRRNEWGKACFTHDASHSGSNDLAKRTISDDIFKDRAYEIARNRKYDGYQRALASMVYRFFDKKTWSGISVNEQLAAELYKPFIKTF